MARPAMCRARRETFSQRHGIMRRLVNTPAARAEAMAPTAATAREVIVRQAIVPHAMAEVLMAADAATPLPLAATPLRHAATVAVGSTEAAAAEVDSTGVAADPMGAAVAVPTVVDTAN